MLTTSVHHTATTAAATAATTWWTGTWSAPPTLTPPDTQSWDNVMAAICIACFLFGTVGNILSLIYFTHQRKDLPTKIYILMTVTDTFSCMLVIVVVVSYLNSRDPSLFVYPWLCGLWSTVWNVTPYFSVFLVLVLSVVRTICLTNPFRTISHRIVMLVTAVYLVYLFTRTIVPDIMEVSEHRFKGSYCVVGLAEQENGVRDESLYHYLIMSNAFQLMAPVIPILVSCVVSIYCVLKSRKMSALSRTNLGTKTSAMKRLVEKAMETEGKEGSHHPPPGKWKKVMSTTRRHLSTMSSSSSQDRQKQATITILVITCLYILFNVPIFIYYLLFVLDNYVFKTDFFMKNYFVKHYGWNLVFVVCVAANAALNPIVYCTRIKKIREFYALQRVKGWIKSAVRKLAVCFGLRAKSDLNSQSGRSSFRSHNYTEVLREESL